MVDSSISPQGKETVLLADLGALRTDGGRVQAALGVSVHLIKIPMTVKKMFPIVIVMGVIMEIGGPTQETVFESETSEDV